MRIDGDGEFEAFSVGTYSGHVWCESKMAVRSVERFPSSHVFKGFVIEFDPDTTSMQVVRVSNAFPRVETTHVVTLDGVISGE